MQREWTLAYLRGSTNYFWPHPNESSQVAWSTACHNQRGCCFDCTKLHISSSSAAGSKTRNSIWLFPLSLKKLAQKGFWIKHSIYGTVIGIWCSRWQAMLDWWEKNFATCELGDRRLNERAMSIGYALGQGFGKALSEIFNGANFLKRAYEFLLTQKWNFQA